MSGAAVPPVVLDPEKLPRTSWRNGTGTTRFVAAGGERDATWRVSVADIDGPCRFSHFPDTWRWSLVAAGSGLTVSVDGSETDLRRGEAIDYSGTADVAARPAAGSDLPVEVLNLMVTAPDGDLATVPRGAGMQSRELDGPVTWSPHTVAVLVTEGSVLTNGSVASSGQFLIGPSGTGTPVAQRARCVEMVVGA
jgi:environmental stress-induced protein Ves